MRGKRNEIEQLETGLSIAKDPYQIADLLSQSRESLADHVATRIRYTAMDMADQGRYLHAIKKLCTHGDWEDFVNERKWSWEYVRCCMKLTEVAAWLPQVLNVPAGSTIQRLLHLPKPDIKAMLADMSPDEASTLTLWDMRRLHNKIPKKPEKKKDYPITPPPSDLDMLVAKAQSALLLIYDLKLAPEEYERAARYRNDLQLAWDRASYNLRDPEHKTTPIFELGPMADDITEDDDE